MKYLLLFAFAAAVAPLAHADVLTITGSDGNYAFTLPSSPTPIGFETGVFFVTVPTTSSSPAVTELGFGSSAYFSQFGLLLNSTQFDFAGPQLYTNGEANPILVPGVYTMVDEATGGDSTFTITDATPEPSSLVLLGTGVSGLVTALRRRRKA